ncbi:hypothetical protein [uncultured Psychroserpens sp.]|uniref:hypothetical protein n=1 Tax=uncultured Psychroserpens sp. TaxID=255436 RepID=UPI00262D9214|nr:hypothetical protein [uncultured Psychroserpens sp.]
MKIIYTIVVCLLCLAATQQTNAQGQNSEYTLQSEHVFSYGEDKQITSTITITESTFNWIQFINDDTAATNFNIVSVSGQWNESTSTGQLNYTLNIVEDGETYQASFTIEGTSAGLSAELICILSETEQEVYEFSINGITYQ